MTVLINVGLILLSVGVLLLWWLRTRWAREATDAIDQLIADNAAKWREGMDRYDPELQAKALARQDGHG